MQMLGDTPLDNIACELTLGSWHQMLLMLHKMLITSQMAIELILAGGRYKLSVLQPLLYLLAQRNL